MIGAISPERMRMTNGDSGGPLLITINQNSPIKQYVQIGVTSGGEPLGLDNYNSYKHFPEGPDVFANLMDQDILDFIKKTIKNN